MIGALAFCGLPYLFCMAGDKGWILQEVGAHQFPACHIVFIEGDGGDLLRMDRSVLWRNGPDDRYLGLSPGKSPGI